MDLKVFSLLVCLLYVFDPTSSIALSCNYNKAWTYQVLGAIYRCQVKGKLNITSYDDAKMDSATGTHETYQKQVYEYGYDYSYGSYRNHYVTKTLTRTNAEVYGIDIRGMTVEYFPRDIATVFASTQLLIIQDSHLKAVNQTDLKPLTSLYVLDLEGNEIEILEQGLFDFNSYLSWVSLAHNKILHVDLNVFDKSGSLTTLNFASNKCVSPVIAHDSGAVKQALIEIKDACQDPAYLRLNNTIKAVRKELETVKLKNFKQFSDKLYGLQQDFKNSEWAAFPRFIEDVHNLTNHKKFLGLENMYAIKTRIADVEVKDMTQRVKDIEPELTDFDEAAAEEIDEKLEELTEKLDNFKAKFSSFMDKINEKLSGVDLEVDNENVTEFGRTINVLGKKVMRKFDRKLRGLERRMNNKIL
ncbi:uncharacterized protein [Chironomus tepperi]|uniref:uncharacterized protein n=1 Tax=Chironomus tepperi TaxID=113505 RepID=UPI00391F6EA9